LKKIPKAKDCKTLPELEQALEQVEILMGNVMTENISHSGIWKRINSLRNAIKNFKQE